MTASAYPEEHFDDLIRLWTADPRALDSAQLAGIRAWALRRARAAGRVSAADAEEIADDAIARMFEAIADSRVDPATSPAYLTRVVQNAVIDRARRRSREVTAGADVIEHASSTEPGADLVVVRLLDRLATVETVVAAMKSMAADGDAVAVRVVGVWLDLASATGAAPSTRQVAHEAKVSHTTVANVLARFGARLGATRDPRQSG